jgi:hypothetical protein
MPIPWVVAAVMVTAIVFARPRRAVAKPTAPAQPTPEPRHPPINYVWQPEDDMTEDEVAFVRFRLRHAVTLELQHLMASRRQWLSDAAQVAAPIPFRPGPNDCPTCHTTTNHIRAIDGARWCDVCEAVFWPEGAPTPGLDIGDVDEGEDESW